MKTPSLFNLGDAVEANVARGTVVAHCPIGDHWECLVQWPDKTCSWVAEHNLKLLTPPTAAPVHPS